MSKNSLTVRKLSGNRNISTIGFLTAQKIIHRLLTCNRIKTSLENEMFVKYIAPGMLGAVVKPLTKEELAHILDVSVEELIQLSSSPGFYARKAQKIALPLVRLHCAVKFNVS